MEDTLARLVAGSALDDQDVPTQCRWTCSACGSTLGWLDPETGEVRRRVGGDLTYVLLGVGGSVTVACGRCAAINVLSAEEVGAAAASHAALAG